MNARATLSSIAAGCCLAATVFTGTAEAHTGFAGSWTATDPGDDSSMTLEVRSTGGRYVVRLVDDAASTCGGVPATVNGAGVVDGNELWVPMTLVCMPGGNSIRQRIVLGFSYDHTTDTLTDTEAVTWNRAG